MNIVGVDASLTGTGVAWIDADGIETYVVKTKLVGVERLSHIETEVVGLCVPDTVVILEGYSYGSKGRAVFNIGELGGVLRLAFHRARIGWLVVPPTVMKKYVTGSGTASKAKVVSSLASRMGRTFDSDDEADAVGLLCYGLELAGEQPLGKLPKANLAALKGVTLP